MIRNKFARRAKRFAFFLHIIKNHYHHNLIKVKSAFSLLELLVAQTVSYVLTSASIQSSLQSNYYSDQIEFLGDVNYVRKLLFAC